MAAVLDEVKRQLRIDDERSDAQLKRLIASAHAEYLNFTGLCKKRAGLSRLPADALNGIILMVQADYDGDPATRDRSLQCARALWQPYRVDMGV